MNEECGDFDGFIGDVWGLFGDVVVEHRIRPGIAKANGRDSFVYRLHGIEVCVYQDTIGGCMKAHVSADVDEEAMISALREKCMKAHVSADGNLQLYRWPIGGFDHAAP